MKGILHKSVDKWTIRYDNGNLCLNELPLHSKSIQKAKEGKEVSFIITEEYIDSVSVEFAEIIESKVKTKTREYDFYVCDRCNITTNTKGRMCPCPRGGCEAEVAGTVKKMTITEIKLK